ncbi:MAG TPA: RNA pseudouridine synthase [Candidatus Mediterraneibacter faecipullorum]|uniref:RNA pseudouridylate synthase n=1 Tax=Candidatus Mediterraneibacter faecipullorum TaxID=2838670 RepID=A0A9D2NNA6_9FIRM|nr:RNA pseudouridine synthase [Candidatus Mediterraneibacter faecipullorum]
MQPDIKTFIIYEDPHIIVCHKPAGMPVQSARIGTADLVSLLKNHLASSARNTGASKPPYLAVIHRLDQPVEGLLVFAKSPAAARDLNRQLTSSGFSKYYRATVVGVPDPAEGTLEDYMVKDGRTNTSRICTKETPGAKLARLHYRTEKICEDSKPVTSLVKIKLDTGRHHQIRVQMAHLGCPLAGDRKYGRIFADSPDTGSLIHKNNSTALKLCAYRLEFRHPANGKEMTFKIR